MTSTSSTTDGTRISTIPFAGASRGTLAVHPMRTSAMVMLTLLLLLLLVRWTRCNLLEAALGIMAVLQVGPNHGGRSVCAPGRHWRANQGVRRHRSSSILLAFLVSTMAMWKTVIYFGIEGLRSAHADLRVPLAAHPAVADAGGGWRQWLRVHRRPGDRIELLALLCAAQVCRRSSVSPPTRSRAGRMRPDR